MFVCASLSPASPQALPLLRGAYLLPLPRGVVLVASPIAPCPRVWEPTAPFSHAPEEGACLLSPASLEPSPEPGQQLRQLR